MADPRIPRDLSMFDGAMTPQERQKLIEATFASAPLMQKDATGAWEKAFDQDVELMGRMYRDILKSEQAIPGRPGPRPALDGPRAQPQVDRWLGRDPLGRPYSMLPFRNAFALLTHGHSHTQVARMVGITRTQVGRLLHGEMQPTHDVMEKIASAFKKEPSYFVEYRIQAVTTVIAEKLASAPEESVRSYEKLFLERTLSALHATGNWLYFFFGLKGSGPYNAWWGGAGSDLAYLTGIVSVLLLSWRHLNCGAKGCWRIGLHHVDGNIHKVCHHHHPGMDARKLSVEEIHRRFHAHRAAMAVAPIE